jgi:hypothetical protein
MEPGSYMSDNPNGTCEDGRLKMSYGYVTTQIMKAHMMSLAGIMYSFLLPPHKRFTLTLATYTGTSPYLYKEQKHGHGPRCMLAG